MAGNDNPLWHVAKDAGVYSQYLHGDYVEEGKYLSSLSNDDKKWLGDFWNAYYKRTTQAFNKLNFSVALRRSLYNNHRAVVNDIYHRRTRTSLSENKNI